jgi:hypothetical protein
MGVIVMGYYHNKDGGRLCAVLCRTVLIAGIYLGKWTSRVAIVN